MNSSHFTEALGVDVLGYAIVLEPEAEGGFSVSVPAFPEIHTQCEDVEDALAMARDAIQLSLALRREEGEEIPAPKRRCRRTLTPNGDVPDV